MSISLTVRRFSEVARASIANRERISGLSMDSENSSRMNPATHKHVRIGGEQPILRSELYDWTSSSSTSLLSLEEIISNKTTYDLPMRIVKLITDAKAQYGISPLSYDKKSIKKVRTDSVILMKRKAEAKADRQPGTALDKSGSFSSRLKADVLKKLYAKRVDFTFVRPMAIKKALTNCIDSLKVMLRIATAFDPRNELEESRAFSWNEADFLWRRKVRKSLVWVEMLSTVMTPEFLDHAKRVKDVQELIQWVTKLMTAMLEASNGDKSEVIEEIEAMFDFLKLQDHLKYDLQMNTKRLMGHLTSYTVTAWSNVDLQNKMAKNDYQDKINNLTLISPIEYRYAMSYTAAKESEFQHRAQLEESRIEKQIMYWRKKEEVENVCYQCTLNAHYTKIGLLTEKLSEYTTKYEQTLEAVINNGVIIQRNTDVLKERQKFLAEEMNRFHDEIAHMHETSELRERRSTQQDQKLSKFIKSMSHLSIKGRKNRTKKIGKRKGNKDSENSSRSRNTSTNQSTIYESKERISSQYSPYRSTPYESRLNVTEVETTSAKEEK